MAHNSKRRRLLLTLGALVFGCAGPAYANEQAGSDPAVARVRAFYDSLLTVMKQAKELGIRGRYEKLAPAIRGAFENSIPSEQQAALIDSFTRMTNATYASRFDGYSGERFEVEPTPEARTSGRIVRTRLIQSTGEPIALNYLMRGADDNWKVVDVYLSGTISELATRRAEFGAILKSGGPNALIESLRQQAEKLMRSPAAQASRTRADALLALAFAPLPAFSSRGAGRDATVAGR